MRYIVNITKAAVLFAQAILKALFTVIQSLCRLFGLRPPATPQFAAPSTTPDDVRDEYNDAYEREAAEDEALSSDIGMSVYQYAAATDPAVRGAVDISGLSPAQTDWLLGLRDGDLQKLAAAGPRACELAASGKRSGIVGLPQPTAMSREIEGPHPVRNLLMERIQASHAARAKLST